MAINAYIFNCCCFFSSSFHLQLFLLLKRLQTDVMGCRDQIFPRNQLTTRPSPPIINLVSIRFTQCTHPQTQVFVLPSPFHCVLNWLNVHVKEINHFDTIGVSREDFKYFSCSAWASHQISHFINKRGAEKKNPSFIAQNCAEAWFAEWENRRRINVENWNWSFCLPMWGWYASYLFTMRAYLLKDEWKLHSTALSENRLKFRFHRRCVCVRFLIDKKLLNNVGW